jgi:hypothetical protein
MADGNIEKQLEGNSLALSAVAEVLSKMDARFAKADEDSNKKAQAEASSLAKADLVTSIAKEVLAVIKNEPGMDVSGKDRPAQGGGSASDADDSSVDANISADIKEQQNTIQASRLAKEEDEEDEEDDMEKGGMTYKDEEDDEAIDIPVEDMEKDDDEDDDDDEIENMKKQIKALTKQLSAKETSIKKQIKVGTEESLRKMGFREETSLKAPKLINGLGVDNTPLVKANKTAGDVSDQLVDLSYKQLRDLQHKIQMGETDGVPQELLG